MWGNEILHSLIWGLCQIARPLMAILFLTKQSKGRWDKVVDVVVFFSWLT